jgi:hypothetical protein
LLIVVILCLIVVGNGAVTSEILLVEDELSHCCVGMQIHVANVIGVSQCVVSMAWIRYHVFGTAVRRYAGGRRATTPREDRFLTL